MTALAAGAAVAAVKGKEEESAAALEAAAEREEKEETATALEAAAKRVEEEKVTGTAAASAEEEVVEAAGAAAVVDEEAPVQRQQLSHHLRGKRTNTADSMVVKHGTGSYRRCQQHVLKQARAVVEGADCLQLPIILLYPYWN